MKSLKAQNWTLILILFIVAIAATIIGQLLVTEETVIVDAGDGTQDSITVKRTVEIPWMKKKAA